MMTAISSGTSRFQGRCRYCGVRAMKGGPRIRTGASFLQPRGSNLTEAMARATLNMTMAGMIPSAEHFMKATCPNSGQASLTLKNFFVFHHCIRGVFRPVSGNDALDVCGMSMVAT